MEDLFLVFKILGILIGFMVLMELLDLPDWVAQKLRGRPHPSELEDQIRSLEARIKSIEDNLQ